MRRRAVTGPRCSWSGSIVIRIDARCLLFAVSASTYRRVVRVMPAARHPEVIDAERKRWCCRRSLDGMRTVVSTDAPRLFIMEEMHIKGVRIHQLPVRISFNTSG